MTFLAAQLEYPNFQYVYFPGPSLGTFAPEKLIHVHIYTYEHSV